MRISQIFIITLAVVCFGCASTQKQESAPKMDYFAGAFTYMADAASFADCATGVRYPVSNSGAYLIVERHYLSMNPNPAEAIFMEAYAHIEMQQSMEESQGKIPTLVLDSLLRFDRTISCDPDGITSGMYRSDTDKTVQTLRLNSDYTYTQTLFAKDGTETKSTGTWGLASELILILKNDKGEYSSFEIIPNQQSLTMNNGTEPLVFKKEYLN